MNGDGAPSRVRFYDRQFLQAKDLQDEQAYHVQMRWRHNLALHSWGIVAGLDLRVESDSLIVNPGMAIDGYGREIVLAQSEIKPLHELDTKTSFEVWLEYARVTGNASVRSIGIASCRMPEPDRETENPQVHLRKRSARRSPDPARPDEVPTSDLNPRPDQSIPIDPTRRWPVYLGRLDFSNSVWVPDHTQRRYAGLVADRIEHPPGTGTNPSRTRIINGSPPGKPSVLFAVGAVDDNQAEDNWLTVTKTDDKREMEFQVDRVMVGADLTLKDGASVEFQANPVGLEDNPSGLVGSEFWRIYHHFGSNKKQPDTEHDKDEPPAPIIGFTDELRITMPTTPDQTNRVVIGCFSEETGAFTPILVVNDDRSVKVYGALVVEGKIVGKLTDAPAGTSVAAGGLPSDNQIMEFLRLRMEDSHFNTTLVKTLAEHQQWPSLANELLTYRDSLRSLLNSMWGSNASTPRDIIGSTAASIGDAAPQVRYFDFLNALHPEGAPPEVEPDPKFVEFIANWIFDENRPARAGWPAAGLGAVPRNLSFAAFAKKLSLENIKALVKALLDNQLDHVVTALTDASLSAKLKELLAKLVSAAASQMIEELIKANKEVEMVVGMAAKPDGLTDPALQQIGESIPADNNKLNHLLSTLLSNEDRGRKLAEELLKPAPSREHLPTPGQLAVARALKQGLPLVTELSDLSKTADTPLRNFLQGVKRVATLEVHPLKEALMTLCALYDDDNFGP